MDLRLVVKEIKVQDGNDVIVENLQSATCVSLSLSCPHFFHFQFLYWDIAVNILVLIFSKITQCVFNG